MLTLDSRLQADTLVVGDLPLCRLLLSRDANYPWFILVPRREQVSEVFDLDEQDLRQLWAEASALAEALSDVFAADKMNVATLGNVVSQLHLHVIVRYRDDAAWPAPVWGHAPAKAYEAAALAERCARVKALLGDNLQEVPV